MSKKDYRQGMADAMESYVPFGEKQEAAIRHVGDQVKQTADKVDKLGGKIGDLVDYISDREKAALYKLNTPVDIADLDDAEKRILLAVLYRLRDGRKHRRYFHAESGSSGFLGVLLPWNPSPNLYRRSDGFPRLFSGQSQDTKRNRCPY